MKIISSLVFCLTILSANINDPFKNIVYYKLSNGMEVFLHPNEKSKNIKIEIDINAGFELEDERNAGISHLLEHMIFRDQRIPYKDYLDYFNEEGATSINAYTSRYRTSYYGTIESSKAYWFVEKFHQMIFDKQVTNEDLIVEKGALQTEIGEPDLLIYTLQSLAKFLEEIFPIEKTIYESDFNIQKIRDLPLTYYEQINNKKFTLEDVMKHYKMYYYPSNMKLKIVGNFEIESMKKLIKSTYGIVENTKQGKTLKPIIKPQLNNQPYERYYLGFDKNYASLGVKYITKDMKESLILDMYVDYMKHNVQQELRNNLGSTYSVSDFYNINQNIWIAGIEFDSLHDNFEKNIQIAKKMFFEDIQTISDEFIQKAINSFKKTFIYENDVESQIGLVRFYDTLLMEFPEEKKTYFEVYKDVDIDFFRDTIQKIFDGKNSYMMIERDYYFFKYDYIIYYLLMIFMLVYLYLKIFHIHRLQQSIEYKNIITSFRISNRFLSFFYIFFLFLIVSILYEWIVHIFQIENNFDYYDEPLSFIILNLDYIASTIFTLLFFRYFIPYTARIDVSETYLYIIGHKFNALKKNDIQSIEYIPHSYKHILGSKGIRFLPWKGIVSITMKDNKNYRLKIEKAHLSHKYLNDWLSNEG